MNYDSISAATSLVEREPEVTLDFDTVQKQILSIVKSDRPADEAELDVVETNDVAEDDAVEANEAAEESLDDDDIPLSGTVAIQESLPRPRSMAQVVGESSELIEVFTVVDRVADTNCTVLITGDSGTGKELVAQAVHNTSSRASGPFVTVNCGAIPETLLESELFGHAKGAFTGATANKLGRIGMAHRGTLFLDEIGELPLSLQVKLLRVLQAHEYSPVGDNRTLKADVRVVAATNIDLEDAVAKGTFRQDLYYRLNVIHLQMPALRRRAADIPILVDHFMGIARKKTGRNIQDVSRAAMQLLTTYAWPGNVRELENTIERALLLCASNRIEATDLPARLRGLGSEQRTTPKLPESGLDLRAAVESYENDLIRQALERTSWNKNRAANLLCLNRTTLVEMLKRKRINPKAA